MVNSSAVSKDNRSPQEPYTPIQVPELTDIITHLNEEHLDELIAFASVVTDRSEAELDKLNLQLSAIYAEGFALQAQPQPLDNRSTTSQKQVSQNQLIFIPFTTSITQLEDLQTQYILLKQRVDKKLGKKTIKLTKQAFSVQSSTMVSKNMLRLELSLPDSSTSQNADNDADTAAANQSNSSPMPINEPGYAYLFDLEHNIQDSQKRDNIKTPRPHCYYTLRKAWQTDTGRHAWVDVFLHGDTSGGVWAKSLQAGDTVLTKREVPEKIEHLQEGKALLIADETSIPTVAHLLELWDNPLPPLVLCITGDTGDQAYFDEVKRNPEVKSNFTIVPIVTAKTNAGADLATLIDNKLGDYLAQQPLVIDKVWGALEASTAKALRKRLKNRLHLERSDMVVKVYWRHD